jgi:pSer/pThr/pTyr-binding forkhead associated (FHA) protein
MDMYLNMIRPDGTRSEFELTKSSVVMGRGSSCDFQIPIASVSREHCRLERRDDGHWYLIDLASSSGTICNKKRIDECRVRAGDIFIVGKVVFTLSMRQLPSDELPEPLVDDGVVEKSDESDETKTDPPAMG